MSLIHWDQEYRHRKVEWNDTMTWTRLLCGQGVWRDQKCKDEWCEAYPVSPEESVNVKHFHEVPTWKELGKTHIIANVTCLQCLLIIGQEGW